MSACNSSREAAEQEVVRQPRADTTAVEEEEITEADVLTDLFASVNSKDWYIVNDLYADSVEIKDDINRVQVFPRFPASYFQELIKAQDIKRIEIVRMLKQPEGILVNTDVQMADNKQSDMCFMFRFNGLEIKEQQTINCKQY